MTLLEKTLLWGSTIAVAVSGIGFAVVKYLLVSDDPFAVVNHPWQPFLLKAHILAAPVFLFALGLVFARHVSVRWASGDPRGRRSGGWLMALCGCAALTGYLLQVLTTRASLRWLGFVHLGLGLAYLAASAFHQVRARVRETGDEGASRLVGERVLVTRVDTTRGLKG